MTTIAIGARLQSVASERRDDVAVVDQDRTLSYRELAETSARMAASLIDRGLAPGQSTAISTRGMDYVLAYLAIVQAGNRAIPIANNLRGELLIQVLRDTDATAVLTSKLSDPTLTIGAIARVDVDELEAPLRPLPQIESDAEAHVLFSSGVTGAPKGVIHTHSAAVHRARFFARLYGAGQRTLTFAPMTWAYGLIDGLLCTLLNGGQLMSFWPYTPGRLRETFAAFEPQVVLGFPFIYKHLGASGVDLLGAQPPTRLFFSGGEMLPSAVRNAFEGRYRVVIRQTYGLSETSNVTGDLHDIPAKPGRVGRLIPGAEIRIVEDRDGTFADAPSGEIWIKRSERFMKGYLKGDSVEARLTDGYYRTGDLGRLDEDGYLELLGRNDDFIWMGGVRVHPSEIENALLAVPGIVDAAMVAERNVTTGEQHTCAFVVVDPKLPCSELEILAHLREQLISSRLPSRIQVIDTIPRNENGKIVRSRLRT